MTRIKKSYNWSLVTSNIYNFEFLKYWSFYIFQILTPTPPYSNIKLYSIKDYKLNSNLMSRKLLSWMRRSVAANESLKKKKKKKKTIVCMCTESTSRPRGLHTIIGWTRQLPHVFRLPFIDACEYALGVSHVGVALQCYLPWTPKLFSHRPDK